MSFIYYQNYNILDFQSQNTTSISSKGTSKRSAQHPYVPISPKRWGFFKGQDFILPLLCMVSILNNAFKAF